MTQPNENEAIGTNEPCIEVTELDGNLAIVEVSVDHQVTMVCVKGHGAGNIHIIYHDGKLMHMTIFNGKVTKKTHTKSHSSHVDLRFEGDY